ncbi:exodeoxyribonuclease VII large subunit, partial [bacterium]|nr:exodeoxyribonuclease VII large subunit [bacterium]
MDTIINGAVTVTDLNGLIRDWLENCPLFNDIWIFGEIRNLKRYAAGNQIYFSLADSESTISCVIFQSGSERLATPIADGHQVLVRGKVRFFPKRGTLQIQVNYVTP